jgi:tetratricopeptide (TPR) repeat protein
VGTNEGSNMKKQPGRSLKIATRISSLHFCHKMRSSSGIRGGLSFRVLCAVIAAWMSFATCPVLAQNMTPHHDDGVTIQGRVLNSAGRPVSEAQVRLLEESAAGEGVTRTNATGGFEFKGIGAGSYTVSAEKSGLRSRSVTVIASSPGGQQKIELILEDSGSVQTGSTAAASPAEPMEFADKPNFTVAGITDWTAVGGHGSDSSLRTSETLVRETMSLKPADPAGGGASTNKNRSESAESESKLRASVAGDPGSYEANHQLGNFYLHAARYREAIPLLQSAYNLQPANHENEYDLALTYQGAGDLSQARQLVKELLAHGEKAEWYSLEGDIDEKLGDPLNAVHEYEQATLLSPNEANYFEWGSELLLHRAVWQAQEVFQKGAKAFPKSSRMLAALGAALFAGARYDEAAQRFCEASDLNQADPKPYEFMGKIEMEAPNPLACIDQKLARYLQQQPENSLANYFYAMAIWKGQEQSADEWVLHRVETLLTKAVKIDSQCADGYFQLGNLYSSRLDYGQAISFYKRAIDVNPQLGDAHYRLGVAYDRTGEREKAQQEFKLHEQLKKQQADEVERQRREVKQFLVVVPGGATQPPAD